jgi:HTH-type transcriptional regulator/antitoxin HigA
MTTLTIEKKIKRFRETHNHLVRSLLLRLSPQPIKDKNMHKVYSVVLEMLAKLLAEENITGDDKEAVETYFGSVSHFVAEYEKEAFPLESGTPEDMLQFFMEQFKLKQTDLSDDLGGQPVVSDILHGRRKLNRDQIERLAHRFHVSPGTFYKAA